MFTWQWVAYGVLAAAVLALVFYRVGHAVASRALEKEIREIEYLSLRGWHCEEQTKSYWPSYWTAPDETEARRFDKAVERQRELDRIQDLNLPEVPQYTIGSWIESERYFVDRKKKSRPFEHR